MSSIVDIAYKFLERVKRQGGDHLQSLCPFHQERDPSFSINVETGLWLCFSCGVQGNLQQLLDHFEIPRGLQEAQYGIALERARQHRSKPQDPTRPNVVTQDPVPEEILGLFRSHHPSLLAAGFRPETLDYFEVGYDQQHARITYPIRDIHGNLLGINGRAVHEGQEPRYKVYTEEYEAWGLPAREEVKKGTVLWHAHKLYRYTRMAAGPPFIAMTEGYKACMWVWQAGITDVVALQTQRLSASQRWVVEKIGVPVHLMLDNNERGWQGMGKIAQEIGKKMTVRIVDYDTEQPDGLEEEQVRILVPQARDFVQVMFSAS